MPPPPIFHLPETLAVETYFIAPNDRRFSSIPLSAEKADQITGYARRSDPLTAQARGLWR